MDQTKLDEAKSINLNSEPVRASRFGSSTIVSGAVSTLRIFGWIALVAGILGALLIILNIPERPLYSTEPSVAPQYFAAAIGLAFQGAFAFVLCRVIAEIAEDGKLVRREMRNKRS